MFTIHKLTKNVLNIPQTVQTLGVTSQSTQSESFPIILFETLRAFLDCIIRTDPCYV